MAEEKVLDAGPAQDDQREEEGAPRAPVAGITGQDVNTPPDIFLCPISREVMRDPVVLVETGQVYDRHSITEWFKMGHSTCPLTGAHLWLLISSSTKRGFVSDRCNGAKWQWWWRRGGEGDC